MTLNDQAAGASPPLATARLSSIHREAPAHITGDQASTIGVSTINRSIDDLTTENIAALQHIIEECWLAEHGPPESRARLSLGPPTEAYRRKFFEDIFADTWNPLMSATEMPSKPASRSITTSLVKVGVLIHDCRLSRGRPIPKHRQAGHIVYLSASPSPSPFQWLMFHCCDKMGKSIKYEAKDADGKKFRNVRLICSMNEAKAGALMAWDRQEWKRYKIYNRKGYIEEARRSINLWHCHDASPKKDSGPKFEAQYPESRVEFVNRIERQRAAAREAFRETLKDEF